MREIEIKARVDNKAVLLAALQDANVKLTPVIMQRDRVFGIPGARGGDSNAPVPWLRIRTETKAGVQKQIFTLKKSITSQLDSIEHETEVADASELMQIITHLGFTPYSDLTKTRQKGMVGDVEICIDHIEGLGDFIEAEKITKEDADSAGIIEELWRLLESLGVGRDAEETDGYDIMQRKQRGLEL